MAGPLGPSLNAQALAMDIEQRYREAASHALAGFQLVEQQLKEYIGYYYDAVRFLLNGKLSFNYAREEMDEAALERLTTVFSKINGNEELIKRIRALIKHRNHVAHRALVHLYGKERTGEELETNIDEFIEIAEKLGLILRDLLKETVNVARIKSSVKEDV